MPAPLQQRKTVDNNEIREYNVIEVGRDTQQPLRTKRKLINFPKEDLSLLGLPPSPTCDSSDEDNLH
ncbi:5379_t:CDS:2 [Gigaspora rosea]|nr:5379_t:CDS:2 [Gigaspora rosea]